MDISMSQKHLINGKILSPFHDNCSRYLEKTMFAMFIKKPHLPRSWMRNP